MPLIATASPDDTAFLPPHEATQLPGFHVYSHRMAVAPGEKLDLRVSGDGPVSIEIVKLRRSVADSSVVAKLPAVTVTPQVLHRGSYIYVEKGIALPAEFTVEVWFRTLADMPGAGIFSHASLTIHLLEGNVVQVRLMRKGIDTAAEFALPVPAIKVWHHLVAVVGPQGSACFLNGVCVAQGVSSARGGSDVDRRTGSRPQSLDASQPLLLGAKPNDAGEASGFFTGDLWAPTIYAGQIPASVIAQRCASKALVPADGFQLLGRWEFDALHGMPYRDSSEYNNHGKPVNVPIRMVPGPRVTADSDWSTYDPNTDPDFGYAVRLMRDALVDCRWPVTSEWHVPAELPQGQYAARLRDAGGQTRDVHFLVRPGKKRAKMACFSTTNTRMAYNFESFGDAALDYGCYAPHPCYPILGQIIGQRRPAGGLWHKTTVDFELPFYAWLDSQGIAYDLYSEWDLEADPDLLRNYQVAAWAGHSEYWTINQYQQFKKFNRAGGHLVMMSGNTAFWRVSVDLAQSLLEVRKHDRRTMPGVTCDPMVNSAHHHQFDQWPGGYMRGTGFPEVTLFGTSTGGFSSPPLDGPRSGYSVLRPEHPLFHSPRTIITTGVFADQAAGYETDYAVRAQLDRHGDKVLPVYPFVDGTPFPTAQDHEFDRGLTVLARAVVQPAGILDYDVNYDDTFATNGGMWSDMILWERPAHGRVFAVGSVLASHVLHSDENFSNFLLNALNAVGIASDTANEKRFLR